MLLLHTILPLLFPFLLTDTATLLLQQDLKKDAAILQKSKSYFINDNASLNPTLATVAADLQLFQLVASLDLTKANYSSESIGKHQLNSWKFSNGDITAIHQIESMVTLDTVVAQHYLENRPPTQHQITNNFTFRTYVISTAANPAKLYYLTEAEQGLLAYKIEKREVQISYTAAKEGLSDVLPKYKAELSQLLQSIK